MATSPHRICYVPHIMEEILLQMDMCTLLTSQRVCHYWHSIITESDVLQEHLFFKPVDYQVSSGSDRMRNPLLENNLWPHFLRKRLHTIQRDDNYERLQFPMIDAAKEDAYLRPEASWRKMLLQQPPTSHIGIVETYTNCDTPLFTRFAPDLKNNFLRMGHIDTAVISQVLMPGQDKWLFWFEPNYLNRSEREFQGERAIAVSKYLKDCDLVIFTECCYSIHHAPHVINRLDGWVVGLGRPKVVKDCRRVRVWP